MEDSKNDLVAEEKNSYQNLQNLQKRILNKAKIDYEEKPDGKTEIIKRETPKKKSKEDLIDSIISLPNNDHKRWKLQRKSKEELQEILSFLVGDGLNIPNPVRKENNSNEVSKEAVKENKRKSNIPDEMIAKQLTRFHKSFMKTTGDLSEVAYEYFPKMGASIKGVEKELDKYDDDYNAIFLQVYQEHRDTVDNYMTPLAQLAMMDAMVINNRYIKNYTNKEIKSKKKSSTEQ